MLFFNVVEYFGPKFIMQVVRKNKKVLFVVSIIALGIKMVFYVKKMKRRKKWKEAQQDLVILHIFPRARFTPNLSPFCLKLETYLRLAKIPYESDFYDFFGPKGKCPWITLNSKEYGDSQLCIELLNNRFNKNFNSHLTPEERAIARAFRVMIEEHLYWCLALWMWVFSNSTTLNECIVVPWYAKYLMMCVKKSVQQCAWFQGLARHSQEEITEMAVKDLKAISNFIGKKQFLMGDTPCEEDCAMFGMLSQVVWNLPATPFESRMPGEFDVLKQYCYRVKKEIWGEWGQCLNPPQS